MRSSSISASPLPELASPAPAEVDSLDQQHVLTALALAWTARQRNWLLAVVKAMGLRAANGLPFGSFELDACLKALAEGGEVTRTEAGWQCLVRTRAERFREAVKRPDFPRWRDAIMQADGLRANQAMVYFQRDSQAITLARLTAYGGGSLERWRAVEAGYKGLANPNTVIDQVALSGFDPELFDRVDRGLASGLLGLAMVIGLRELDPAAVEPFRYARAWVERDGAAAPAALRLKLAEWLVMRQETDAARAVLRGLEGAEAISIRAASSAVQGRWSQAIEGFEEAFKLARQDASRKSAVPESMRWLYPMSLFASRDPQRIADASRFCMSESAPQRIEGDSFWGLWVQAAQIRLGERSRDPHFASFKNYHSLHLQFRLVARRMLQAWVAAGHGVVANPGRSDALLARLRECGFQWLASQVEAADQVLAGQAPSVPFFASGGDESWRDALAAIAALGAERSAEQVNASAGETRLLWVLSVDRHDRLTGIAPYERKRGMRDWGKPKSVPLSRLAKAGVLDPLDARVARAIRPDRRFGAQRATLDLVDAASALVGHPRVVFPDDLDHPIEIVESSPDIRLVRRDDHWTIRFEPDLNLAFDREPVGDDEYLPESMQAAPTHRPDFALRTQFLVRDRPDASMLAQGGAGAASAEAVPRRARLIRLTPAQRRVVELAQAGLKIPCSAVAEVQAVLPVLGAHFRLQADAVDGTRTQEAETRLRVEMARRGEAVLVRLMAAPLGASGPRLSPGHGREDLLAVIDGVMVSTLRDLAAERAAVTAIVETFPFLSRHDDDWQAGIAPEWTIGDPQRALELIERLGDLDEVAGIDWPSGQAVKLLKAPDDALGVRVRARGHWFVLDGQLKVDEQQVVELARLIEFVGRQRSRFVPIGENTYVALTDRLRQRIEELAAVTEAVKPSRRATADAADGSAPSPVQPPVQQLRAPQIAAQWIDQALGDLPRQADLAFVDRVAQLNRFIDASGAGAVDESASALPLPAGLQAELRPYQEAGYRWVMQRSAAGLGVCLADDMGLGKTVQTLAVLLARAAAGPALVVAPTSLCANWIIEASRFAPSLRMHAVASGFSTDLASLGAQDVVVVSYTLLQQSLARFAPVRWATVVADEAQAIKNASAKRSQAVADLSAGMRIALSGTPIENRLSELWSIMNFVNPGLLGSRERFAERFVMPIERTGDVAAQRILRRLISPFVLRRTKQQVLRDLPSRTEVMLTATPDGAEAAHYEALRREALQTADQLASASSGRTGSQRMEQQRFHVLAQLTRLRRAACDPRLVNPELAVAGAKTAMFIDLAEELVANGHKALVFSQFVDYLQLLRTAVEAAGIRYQYLDGSTPAADRQRKVDAFQAGDGDLFLISLKAGGFGLNLTAADYVVIVDPWWNPAAEDQAMGRAHRIGQQRPVTVYRLVTAASIEERIVRLHADKRALADGILEDIDSSVAPSTSELIDLLRDVD